MKKNKQSFAQGQAAWAPTLKKSSQNVNEIGRTSQNRSTKRKFEATSMLRRGMQGKKK